jgi:hypothetical protein
MELRPLDLSAIFERAIALYARNFLSFAGMVAVTVVPVAILQYVIGIREEARIDATLDVLQHPDLLRTEHVPTLFNSPATVAVIIASALFLYYMSALALGAVAAGVGQIYRGTPPGFRLAYEAVLQRWSSIVAIVGMAVLALVAAYAFLVVVASVPILAAAALARSWFPTLTSVALGGVIVLIGFALVVILISASCAICAVTVENCTASSALRLTFARIFTRDEFGRALLCALWVGAIGFVLSAIFTTLGLFGLFRLPGAQASVDALVRTLILPFVALVLALYYFDVRIRQEVLELEPSPEEPVYAPTAYLSGEERAMVKRFLDRRQTLAPRRRRQIAAQLAGPARQRVPADLQGLDDEALLERL